MHIPCAGYSLSADWYDKKSDEVLLVLPGFMSAKANYADFVSSIIEQTRSAALVVDYTGHGESPFILEDIRPAQHFMEVITAFDWIVEHHPNKKIAVLGTSYGGFHATQLTKYRSFNKLALRTPALYPPDMFYTQWRNIDRDEILQYRSDPGNMRDHPLLNRAKRFKGRTLVVAHELDKSCPKVSTDAFIEAFSATTWTAPGLKHGFRESKVSPSQTDDYNRKIAAWLQNNT